MIIGGKYKNDLIACYYIFDFSTQEYFAKPAYKQRINPKVIKYSDYIYILGGDPEGTCEKLQLEDFQSFQSSESYTSFYEKDIINYPASYPTIKLSYKNQTEIKIKNLEHKELF